MSKTTNQPETITPKYTKGNPLPIENVLAYRKQGLNNVQIAKLLDTTRETVSRKLAIADKELKGIVYFKEHRADAFAKMQRMLLNSITADDIKRMAPDRRMWCLGVLYDKERMERGQSTANVTVHTTVEHYSQQLEDLKAKIDNAAA